MIPIDLLNKYSTRLGNAIRLSAKHDQILTGCQTAIEYLYGSLGPSIASVNGDQMNKLREVKLTQILEHKSLRFHMEMGSWYRLYLPNGTERPDWNISDAAVKVMKADEQLRDNLIARELLISYRGVQYKYDPSEQILLGEEPCLIELPQPEKK